MICTGKKIQHEKGCGGMKRGRELLKSMGKLLLKVAAIVCMLCIIAILGILDVFQLLGSVLHWFIVACAGILIFFMTLVTQDWHNIGIVMTIVAGSSLIMFFCTGLIVIMRNIELSLAEFVGS